MQKSVSVVTAWRLLLLTLVCQCWHASSALSQGEVALEGPGIAVTYLQNYNFFNNCQEKSHLTHCRRPIGLQ